MSRLPRAPGLALALVSGAAVAADAPVTSPGFGSPILSLVQMLVGLALVLAAILGTAWLLRRFGPTSLAAGGVMKVLGGVAVGPRERLVLVEIGDTWLIVGVAPGRVNAVHSMPRPENGAGLPEAAPSPFAERLKQMLTRRS